MTSSSVLLIEQYTIQYGFEMIWKLMMSKVITFHGNKDAHSPPGGRLNKKDGLTRYGNSHVKDKTS